MGKRKYKRLHYEDRQTIEAMSKQGSSVTETYQKGKETVEATFGDSLPTLVDQIRKVR